MFTINQSINQLACVSGLHNRIFPTPKYLDKAKYVDSEKLKVLYCFYKKIVVTIVFTYSHLHILLAKEIAHTILFYKQCCCLSSAGERLFLSQW